MAGKVKKLKKCMMLIKALKKMLKLYKKKCSAYVNINIFAL